MSEAFDEIVEEIIEIDPEVDELVTVFVGDLHHCRERLHELAEDGVPSIIMTYDDVISPMGTPTLQLQVRKEDIQDVAEIFAELWEEVLDLEGVGNVKDVVIDFRADTIICPGCQTELSEVTEDGECPECGLYLGLPEEDESTEAESA